MLTEFVLYLLCLNFKKKMSLKFIPVNFGFSKKHSYSGDTLIRDSRVEYSMVFAYKVIFCCVILLQTHIERTNSIQRYVEVLNTFAHKQYIIMRTKQHRRISLVVHLKMSGLIPLGLEPLFVIIPYVPSIMLNTMQHPPCFISHVL